MFIDGVEARALLQHKFPDATITEISWWLADLKPLATDRPDDKNMIPLDNKTDYSFDDSCFLADCYFIKEEVEAFTPSSNKRLVTFQQIKERSLWKNLTGNDEIYNYLIPNCRNHRVTALNPNTLFPFIPSSDVEADKAIIKDPRTLFRLSDIEAVKARYSSETINTIKGAVPDNVVKCYKGTDEEEPNK